MSRRRIVSINWIEALGNWPVERLDGHPDGFENETLSIEDVPEEELSTERFKNHPAARRLRLEAAVRTALERLSDDERELVERFLLAGQPMTELAELTGRRVHRLTTMYTRACRKLEKYLRPIVRQEFGIESSSISSSLQENQSTTCPICLSGERGSIDSLLNARPPRSTWRPIIARLKTDYGIIITTPQILIGHQRYH